MGFGDTAKKIQTLADRAERTYQKINELREEVEQTQTTVVDTAERVHTLENEMAEQRAVLDAVAREVGVDLDSVSTEAHIVDAEADTTDDGEAETDRVDEAEVADDGEDADEGDETGDDEPAA